MTVNQTTLVENESILLILKFLSVATGYPGSMHDARILRNKCLFQRAENRDILCCPLNVIEILRIRPTILGYF